MELGLESMQALCTILAESPHFSTIFYTNFYTRILRETLTVMTDYRHMSGFKLQVMILQLLCQAVDNPQIIGSQDKLLDQNGQPHQLATNKEFVMELFKADLCQMFPNLNKVQVEGFIIKLFNS